MKKINKNQIVIYVIAFMLVTAGYLNYTEKNIVETASKNEKNINTTDENIGDATLVNSNETVVNSNETVVNSNETVVNSNETVDGEIEKQEIEEVEEKKDEEQQEAKKEVDIKETNSTQTNDIQENDSDYFTYSKLEREKMYSQMLESYQKMLNNTNISEEQKAIAGQEIKNINNAKNSIMICENLITTKGFTDVVMFINGDSINVVVKSEKLSQEQVAQIQNIVIRELNSEIDNIHIMTY